MSNRINGEVIKDMVTGYLVDLLLDGREHNVDEARKTLFGMMEGAWVEVIRDERLIEWKYSHTGRRLWMKLKLDLVSDG
jgi:hypothetical protein